MSLANMRANGVRSLAIWCGCGRRDVINVDHLADDLTVPEIGRRMRCSACGERPEDVRPNWLEYRAPGTPG